MATSRLAARFRSPTIGAVPVPILTPPKVDLATLREYRLGRIREQMALCDIALVILANPANLRYAVDWREYTLFQSRIPTYYL